MFCQLFGKYLLEQRAINESDYRTLINEQMNVRVRLGTIAVADGMMTEEQVEKVNRLQMTQDRRFGDIAVDLGLITDEQLGGLLKKQGDSYLQFVQLLTDYCSYCFHLTYFLRLSPVLLLRYTANL